MVHDLDIYLTARLLIREHGKTAAEEAAKRVDLMLSKRDWDGEAKWRHVLKAIDELQAREPPEDGAVVN